MAFRYERRTADDINHRQKQAGGDWESYLANRFRKYKIKERNRIRILPATWQVAAGERKHYGLDIVCALRCWAGRRQCALHTENAQSEVSPLRGTRPSGTQR